MRRPYRPPNKSLHVLGDAYAILNWKAEVSQGTYSFNTEPLKGQVKQIETSKPIRRIIINGENTVKFRTEIVQRHWTSLVIVQRHWTSLVINCQNVVFFTWCNPNISFAKNNKSVKILTRLVIKVAKE